MATAIKVSTMFIKTRIRECKNEKLGNIARQVGTISLQSIFRRLKELRLGARQPRLWKSPLPSLRDQQGQPVSGRVQLDQAWLKYFGDMELGEITPTDVYISKSTAAEFMEVDFQPDATLLPSLCDIEQILRSTKTDKAAGLDKIPGELLKGCPARMSAVLQPLFFKAVLRGRQPIQWRGGLLIEALKKSGLEMTLSGHRSLFVGSVVGKAYHRFVRSRLIDTTEMVLRGTHFGARRGGTVTQASHVAVLYEAAQAAKKRSSALLFMDAKSAYYCVIRQLIYGSVAGEEDQVILRIMNHFRLPEESWHKLLRTIEHGGLFKEHGLSDHVRHLTKDLHDASFFVTRNSTGAVVVETQLGSRPGESIADVIFAWILHSVLDQIEKELRHLDCHEILSASDEPSLWEGADGGCTPILGPIWADDGAFLTSDEEPGHLWSRARSLATTVVRIFFECGLVPNLEKGKSEMMITFRGHGSRQAQTAVFGNGVRTMGSGAGKNCGW